MVFVMRCFGAQSYHASNRHPGLEPGPIHPPLVRLDHGSWLKAGMTNGCETAHE